MTVGITEKGATQRWDDLDVLMIPFRARVIALLGRMKALGFDPVVWETFRSKERAEMLARKGTGIKESMHTLGCAADIVCGAHHWDCDRHGCEFFESLGEQAERLNLVWGGRWKKRDLPHVQGCAVKDQDRLRSMPAYTDREAFVAAYLDRRPIEP